MAASAAAGAAATLSKFKSDGKRLPPWLQASTNNLENCEGAERRALNSGLTRGPGDLTLFPVKRLIRGIVEFRKKVRPGYRETFARLALGQAPDALLIACSDSRVA